MHGMLPNFIQQSYELVQFVVSIVAGEPECFAVVWITLTTKAAILLFLPLVDDWNAVHEHCECNHVLRERQVVILRWEPWDVVVLAEGAEQRSISARATGVLYRACEV